VIHHIYLTRWFSLKICHGFTVHAGHVIFCSFQCEMPHNLPILKSAACRSAEHTVYYPYRTANTHNTGNISLTSHKQSSSLTAPICITLAFVRHFFVNDSYVEYHNNLKKGFNKYDIQGVPGGMCQTSEGCSINMIYKDKTVP